MKQKTKSNVVTKTVNNLTEDVLRIVFRQDLKNLTAGQWAADKITLWAGSWTFIISLFMLIAAWIYLNIAAYIGQWDPWPFIILNLVLSCLAAIQAPIILMSQNRQSLKDRLRAEYDYKVNRRAEREIRGIRKQLDRIEEKTSKKR